MTQTTPEEHNRKKIAETLINKNYGSLWDKNPCARQLLLSAYEHLTGVWDRPKQTHTTADPTSIHIILMADGGWNWDVSYDGNASGLSQDGKAKTLDEAMRHVNECIENGRTEP